MNPIKKFFWMYKFNKKIKNTTNITKEYAIKILDEFLPGRLESPAFTHSLDLIEPSVDLMIIVPVYNVEKYLRKCIESILNQKTQFTYKAVFVNDGSTDNSLQILREYEENSRIEVIDIDNHGVSIARNIALSRNYGRYIMFIDSDDYLEQDAIDKLMTVAQKEKADIVEGGYTIFDEKEHYNFVGHHDKIQCVESNNLFGFPWGKVIKASCMANICFPSGYCYEDTIMTFLVHTNAKKIFTIPNNIIYYRITQESRDKTTLEKNTVVDTFWITKYCLEEMTKHNYVWNKNLKDLCFKQFFVNWLRLNRQSVEIQESVFLLTCELYDLYFSNGQMQKKLEKYKLLEKTMVNKSYEAYQFLMQHWDMFD